jgi:hypothetical protein
MAMRIPSSPKAMLVEGQEGSAASNHVGGQVDLAQLGFVPSLDSQLRLRTLFEYVEACQKTLNEIRADFYLAQQSSSESLDILQRTAQRLGRFCVDADSWRFNDLHDVASGLQMLLLDSRNRSQSEQFWRALNRGLGMLSALLDQCENDFRRRLAVADMLEYFNRTDLN